MRPLATLIGRELTWRRPGVFSRSYELGTDGDTAIAVEVHGFLRRRATVRSAGGSWVVRPSSPIGSARVIEDAAGLEVGGYRRSGLRSFSVSFADGTGYTAKSAWFASSIDVANTAGSTIVSVRWRFPSFRQMAAVVVEPAGSAESRLELLTAIGFLVLLDRRRRAAAGSSGG